MLTHDLSHDRERSIRWLLIMTTQRQRGPHSGNQEACNIRHSSLSFVLRHLRKWVRDPVADQLRRARRWRPIAVAIVALLLPLELCAAREVFDLLRVVVESFLSGHDDPLLAQTVWMLFGAARHRVHWLIRTLALDALDRDAVRHGRTEPASSLER